MGAEHFYADLKFSEAEIGLETFLTKDQARSLNEKHPDREFKYRAGDRSCGFSTREDAEKRAIAECNRVFPAASVLILGYSYILDPQPILYGAAEIAERVNELCRLWEKVDGWNNELAAQPIWNEWRKLMRPYLNIQGDVCV